MFMRMAHGVRERESAKVSNNALYATKTYAAGITSRCQYQAEEEETLLSTISAKTTSTNSWIH